MNGHLPGLTGPFPGVVITLSGGKGIEVIMTIALGPASHTEYFLNSKDSHRYMLIPPSGLLPSQGP